MKEEQRRFIGIDLGKRAYTMAIIETNGKMTHHHGKTSAQVRQALLRLLKQTDKVALEGGNLAFIMAYEIQERVGCEVRVLNAAKLPFIWEHGNAYLRSLLVQAAWSAVRSKHGGALQERYN